MISMTLGTIRVTMEIELSTMGATPSKKPKKSTLVLPLIELFLMRDLTTKHAQSRELMSEMSSMASTPSAWDGYRTAHDLAAAIGQSDSTARRILQEVFPGREKAEDWRLGTGEWEKVLLHLATSDTRHFGRRRRRNCQEVSQ